MYLLKQRIKIGGDAGNDEAVRFLLLDFFIRCLINKKKFHKPRVSLNF